MTVGYVGIYFFCRLSEEFQDAIYEAILDFRAPSVSSSMLKCTSLSRTPRLTRCNGILRLLWRPPFFQASTRSILERH